MKKLKVTEQPLLNLILRDKTKEDYYYTTLNSGLLIFIGAKKSFKIIANDFLDLKVGEKICTVGDPKRGKGSGQATLNRWDEFKPYITYVGYRMEKIHLNSDKEYKILLFQIRDEDKPEVVAESDNYYISYIVLEDHRTDEIVYELKVPSTPDNRFAVRIYKPKFTRYGEHIKK